MKFDILFQTFTFYSAFKTSDQLLVIITLFEIVCTVKTFDSFWTANSQCLLQENHVNLVHIESRKSKRRNSEFEIFVDCDSNHEQLNEIIQLLQKNVNVLDMEPLDNSCLHKEGELKPSAWPSNALRDQRCGPLSAQTCVRLPGSQRRFQTWTTVPTECWCTALSWTRIIRYGRSLKQRKPPQSESLSYPSSPLHQGFKDNVYRKRRKYFADLAMSHKQWVFLRILSGYFGSALLFAWRWQNFPVAAGIPFLGSSSQRRRWRRGEWSTGSLTSCTLPTPAGNTWRTFRCCPNTATSGRTTSLSWRMCRASSGVGFLRGTKIQI